MLSNCVRLSRGTASAQALARFYATSQAQQGHQFASLSKSRNMLSAVADHFFLTQKRSFADSAVKKGFVQVALKSFRDYGIVPDVVDCAPTEVLSACYGEMQVKEGNILTPTEVKDPPTLSWTADGNCFYTVCMTDPDAPSRKDPKFREWHHWLVVNVPGCKVLNGDVLSEYIGSGPPKDTGLHRYVFLVYRQPSKLSFKEKRLKNNSGKGRGGFKIAKFAQKYKLGVPIAGNFFQAEWDDYVPKLNAKLEGK